MAINFPDSPTPGQIFQNYVWDGEKWLGASTAAGAAVVGAVRYDQAQGLTANQMAQARQNTGATKKNYVLNGAMMVSQENGTANLTGSATYAVDMFPTIFISATGTMNFAQTPVATPAGSPYRHRFVANPVNTALGVTEFAMVRTLLEGLRVADLRYGSSTAAKTTTLQFGVKAAAGTYCICIRNVDNTRAYVAEYVIAAGESLIDTVKSVVIPGCPDGTWPSNNTVGIIIDWIIAAGANYRTATPNVWSNAVPPLATSNQFNGIAVTSGFDLFDVGLYEGNVAPPFMVPDVVSELASCQRYWRQFPNLLAGGYNTAGAVTYFTAPLSPPMRAAPTVTYSSPSLNNCSALTVHGATNASTYNWSVTVGSTASFYAQATHTLQARL